MSFSRALTAGCQPLARARLPVSKAATPLSAPFLGNISRFKQQITDQFARSHQVSGVHSRVPNRIATTSSLVEQVQEKNKKFPVLVYSKTWCPYCAEVKILFKNLKIDFTAIELDNIVEGDDVMDALEDLTHRRTVPQVFINGEFIGGGDDTIGAYNSGELKEKLSAAGIAVES